MKADELEVVKIDEPTKRLLLSEARLTKPTMNTTSPKNPTARNRYSVNNNTAIFNINSSSLPQEPKNQ